MAWTESFYGGKPGAAFVIKDRYDRIESVDNYKSLYFEIDSTTHQLTNTPKFRPSLTGIDENSTYSKYEKEKNVNGNQQCSSDLYNQAVNILKYRDNILNEIGFTEQATNRDYYESYIKDSSIANNTSNAISLFYMLKELIDIEFLEKYYEDFPSYIYRTIFFAVESKPENSSIKDFNSKYNSWLQNSSVIGDGMTKTDKENGIIILCENNKPIRKNSQNYTLYNWKAFLVDGRNYGNFYRNVNDTLDMKQTLRQYYYGCNIERVKENNQIITKAVDLIGPIHISENPEYQTSLEDTFNDTSTINVIGYEEYALIDTVTYRQAINDPDNGKIFRRLMVDSSGKNYEYIGQIVGPQGSSPNIDIDGYTKIATSNFSNSPYIQRIYKDEYISKSTSDSTNLTADLVPGKYYDNGDKYNDSIKYAWCNLITTQPNSEHTIITCKIGFQFPYLVLQYNAKPLSPYTREAESGTSGTVSYSLSKKTISSNASDDMIIDDKNYKFEKVNNSTININTLNKYNFDYKDYEYTYNNLICRNDDGDHPYYQEHTFSVPVPVKPQQVAYIGVNTRNVGIANDNGRTVLDIVTVDFGAKESGEFTYTPYNYNIIDRAELHNDGILRFEYTGITHTKSGKYQTYENFGPLDWITGVFLDSSGNYKNNFVVQRTNTKNNNGWTNVGYSTVPNGANNDKAVYGFNLRYPTNTKLKSNGELWVKYSAKNNDNENDEHLGTLSWIKGMAYDISGNYFNNFIIQMVNNDDTINSQTNILNTITSYTNKYGTFVNDKKLTYQFNLRYPTNITLETDGCIHVTYSAKDKQTNGSKESQMEFIPKFLYYGVNNVTELNKVAIGGMWLEKATEISWIE